MIDLTDIKYTKSILTNPSKSIFLLDLERNFNLRVGAKYIVAAYEKLQRRYLNEWLWENRNNFELTPEGKFKPDESGKLIPLNPNIIKEKERLEARIAKAIEFANSVYNKMSPPGSEVMEGAFIFNTIIKSIIPIKGQLETCPFNIDHEEDLQAVVETMSKYREFNRSPNFPVEFKQLTPNISYSDLARAVGEFEAENIPKIGLDMSEYIKPLDVGDASGLNNTHKVLSVGRYSVYEVKDKEDMRKLGYGTDPVYDKDRKLIKPATGCVWCVARNLWGHYHPNIYYFVTYNSHQFALLHFASNGSGQIKNTRNGLIPFLEKDMVTVVEQLLLKYNDGVIPNSSDYYLFSVRSNNSSIKNLEEMKSRAIDNNPNYIVYLDPSKTSEELKLKALEADCTLLRNDKFFRNPSKAEIDAAFRCENNEKIKQLIGILNSKKIPITEDIWCNLIYRDNSDLWKSYKGEYTDRIISAALGIDPQNRAGYEANASRFSEDQLVARYTILSRDGLINRLSENTVIGISKSLDILRLLPKEYITPKVVDSLGEDAITLSPIRYNVESYIDVLRERGIELTENFKLYAFYNEKENYYRLDSIRQKGITPTPERMYKVVEKVKDNDLNKLNPLFMFINQLRSDKYKDEIAQNSGTPNIPSNSNPEEDFTEEKTQKIYDLLYNKFMNNTLEDSREKVAAYTLLNRTNLTTEQIAKVIKKAELPIEHVYKSLKNNPTEEYSELTKKNNKGNIDISILRDFIVENPYNILNIPDDYASTPERRKELDTLQEIAFSMNPDVFVENAKIANDISGVISNYLRERWSRERSFDLYDKILEIREKIVPKNFKFIDVKDKEGSRKILPKLYLHPIGLNISIYEVEMRHSWPRRPSGYKIEFYYKAGDNHNTRTSLIKIPGKVEDFEIDHDQLVKVVNSGLSWVKSELIGIFKVEVRKETLEVLKASNIYNYDYTKRIDDWTEGYRNQSGEELLQRRPLYKSHEMSIPNMKKIYRNFFKGRYDEENSKLTSKIEDEKLEDVLAEYEKAVIFYQSQMELMKKMEYENEQNRLLEDKKSKYLLSNPLAGKALRKRYLELMRKKLGI